MSSSAPQQRLIASSPGGGKPPDACEVDAAYDRAFRRRAPALRLRAELPDDLGFLRSLFLACTPLAAFLPDAMLSQQADLQQIGHRAQFPQAMRRVVSANGVPIGRIVLDWTAPARTHCVDIAVLPCDRSSGAGLMLLRAWLDVADTIGIAAGLTVLHDNPALRLYTHLGFRVVGEATAAPFLEMRRAARPNGHA